MKSQVQEVIADSTIASIANKATYTGAVSAVYGGMTANEIAAFGGLLVAVIGVLIQLFFKLRDDRRNAEYHRERLASIKFGRHE